MFMVRACRNTMMLPATDVCNGLMLTVYFRTKGTAIDDRRWSIDQCDSV
jgi:hypothetical protein